MNNLEEASKLFVYNLKQRFEPNSSSQYKEIMNILTDLAIAIVYGKDLTQLIFKIKKMLLPDHQDLLLRFIHFLPEPYLASAAAAVDYNNPGTLIVKPDDHDVPDPPKKKLCKRKHSFLSQHDFKCEFFNRIRDRCVEKKDVDFSVLTKFMDVVVSYNNKKFNFHEADQMFRNIFKADPDLYVESTHVMSDTLEKEPWDSSGLSSRLLEFLDRARKEKEKDKDNENDNEVKKAMMLKEPDLYEKAMMLKESDLFEKDIILEQIGSLAGRLKRNPKELEEALTANDISIIKKFYCSRINDRTGEKMVKTLQSGTVFVYITARVKVLQRLMEKKQQLADKKLHLEKVWREILEDIKEKGNVCRHRKFWKAATAPKCDDSG